MFALKHFNLFGNIIIKITRNKTFHFSNNCKFQIRNNSLARGGSINTISNDVVLFTSKNSLFFIILNSLSVVNSFFFTYLGFFTYNTLSNIEYKPSSSFFKWLDDLCKKHRILISTTFFILGLSVVPGSLLYTSRSVQKLILQKGGKNLEIKTYKVPGFSNNLIVPVRHVSACCLRKKAKNTVPLKVKDKWFYYVLDVNGKFENPSMFDCTAGVMRNI